MLNIVHVLSIQHQCDTEFYRVVQFQNEVIDSKSVCAWSGQYQETDGKPKILTTWLLTSQTEPKNNWASVRVNKATFFRDPRDAKMGQP